MNNSDVFDVVIVGGGVSGSALAYLLSRYTSLNKIALVEKYDSLASVNSHARNNSQTLHCGDIETNYTLDKARKVKASAEMVRRYISALPEAEKIMHRFDKMVLAVGEEECSHLRERFQAFRELFPEAELLDSKGIARQEPAVVEGRKEEIVAMATSGQHTAVNFQALAQSFVQQARHYCQGFQSFLATTVTDIQPHGDEYQVVTNSHTLQARFIVVSAGGHSLLYAQRMGYGLEYSCLPVAGSFYYAPDVLRGKVYTMQNDKLPFAAIHGDPDLLVPGKTRFGPTALVLPVLERYNLSTFLDFVKVFRPDLDVLRTLWELMKVSDIRNYMLKNVLFEIPLLRTRLFHKDVQKIVPNLRLQDLSFASGIGGIRPVMIDKKNHRLYLGEAKISTGSGLIFNMTPSPGATSCLANAEQDMRIIAEYLDLEIREEELIQDLK